MKKALSLILAALLTLLSATAFATFSPIEIGNTGADVKAVQQRLIQLGYLDITADGHFGYETALAVMAFQTDNGLESSGAVDQETFDLLFDDVGNLITFRGIDWFSTKAETEQALFAEGASSHGWLGSANNIYRMAATDYANVTMGRDRVDEGGYRGWYADVSVAGYNVDDTYACYVYPIVDGKIIRDDEQAELYLAWYTFESGDYSDHQGIYDDLSTKLTSIYGTGKIDSNEYNTTTTWTDMLGNTIRLLINNDKNYVTLGYMAASGDSRLDAMKTALEQEAAAAEAAEREKNSSNTSGL